MIDLLHQEFPQKPNTYEYVIPEVLFDMLSNGQVLLLSNYNHLLEAADLEDLKKRIAVLQQAIADYEPLAAQYPEAIKEANRLRIDSRMNALYTALAPSAKPLKVGYVYLMLDKRSGYYKIGYSATPELRERTLQAEQPDIELQHAFTGTIADEKALHKQFAHKRVRGEWFNLTAEDVAAILNQ